MVSNCVCVAARRLSMISSWPPMRSCSVFSRRLDRSAGRRLELDGPVVVSHEAFLCRPLQTKYGWRTPCRLRARETSSLDPQLPQEIDEYAPAP